MSTDAQCCKVETELHDLQHHAYACGSQSEAQLSLQTPRILMGDVEIQLR